ncbi:helix-turn-helix domain-containing protein [uncultured Sphingomonas sp.]|uniref:helix-turn-helix domain-containing protein n=1 Tax=uncultured Sphingomonas sp. TaxID=158754 RepID=UPI0025DF67FC|nr:helix-turn-helix domain-containing protein [uncultured Sphingomonas sp.]
MAVLDVKKIKSAKRVLEIFEFFNSERTEATVMEIAREYGYPQSSTSELLGCLVELGFLTRDRSRRTYRPTAKVAMLGAWTHPRLFRRGHLLTLMDDLAAELECSIVLTGCVNLRTEHLEIVRGGTDMPAIEQPGPLSRGQLGRLLLSVHDRIAIRKLVHRMNSEVADEDRVRCEDFLVQVDDIRTQGFAVSPGLNEGAGGLVAVRLPQAVTNENLSLAIIVGEGDMRGCGFFLRALRETVSALTSPSPMTMQPGAMLPGRGTLLARAG